MGKAMGTMALAAVLVMLTLQAGFPAQEPSEPEPVESASIPPGGPEPIPDITSVLCSITGYFEENLGQVGNPDVRYYARGNPLSVGLTPQGIIYMLRAEGDTGPEAWSGHTECNVESHAFTMEFVGGGHVEPTGFGDLGHPNHFYRRFDPDERITGARSFSEVVYRGVYEDVDVRFHFQDGVLKYDFILGPGADPEEIRLGLDSVAGLRVDGATGDLVISTPCGELRDSRPVFVQEIAGVSTRFTGRYELYDGATWGFPVPEGCERGRPMVIDPGLEFATFLGGTDYNDILTLAVDKAGDIYVGGCTASLDFPVTPNNVPNQGEMGCHDGFITKIHPPDEIVFSAFVGGRGHDEVNALKVLSDGEFWILGQTYGDWIGANDTMMTDPFMIIFNRYCSALHALRLAMTYEDYPTTLHVNDLDEFILAGYTNSPDMPCHEGAFCSTYTGSYAPWSAAFITKGAYDWNKADFDTNYTTYLNGICPNDFSSVPRIVVDVDDATGDVLVAGNTDSPLFPAAPGAYCGSYQGGYSDGFVLRFDPTLSRLLNSSFVGGSGSEGINSIEVGDDGTVYLTGYTNSTDFPLTPNAICATNQGYHDLFAMVMEANLSSVRFSTLLGGDIFDTGTDLALGPNDETLGILGIAQGANFTCTEGCFDPVVRGSIDCVIVVINLTSWQLMYSTYVGGGDYDFPAWDGFDYGDDGMVYAAGTTWSWDFPITPGALNSHFNLEKSYNTFIVKIDPRTCSPPSIPLNLSVLAGDGRVALSWNSPEVGGGRVLGHRIFRGTSQDDVRIIGEAPWRVTNFTDERAVNGVRYYYAVRAFNSAGEGAPNGTWALPLGKPGAPLDLTAETGDGTVCLTWQPPEDTGGEILGYRVLRGSSSTSIEVWEPDVGNSTHFVDLDVTTGKVYYYAVVAWNSKGQGPVGKQVDVVPMAPPAPPTGLVIKPGDRRLTIAWNRPTDNGGSPLTGFRVYRGLSGAECALLVERRSSELSYDDVGLENGRRYYYLVTALTRINESQPTPALSAVPYGIPQAPVDLAACASDRRVLLSWGPPSVDGGNAVHGYVVYTGGSAGVITFSATIGNVTDFVHDSLVNGLIYWYMVAAFNDAGEGPRTKAVSAMPGRAPGPLDYFSAYCLPEGVVLYWSSPIEWGGDESRTYQILRGESEGSMEVLIELSDQDSYIDASAEGGRTYLYSARAVNAFGGSPLAVVIPVDVRRVPGPVSGLEAVAGDGFVSLSWSAPAYDGGAVITAYVLYRGLGELSLMELARLGEEKYYADTDVVNLRTVYYRVVAINGIGFGVPSRTVNATPMALPGEPVLFTAKVQDGAIVLSWGAPYKPGSAPLMGYDLFRGTSLDDTRLIACLGTETIYIDEDVQGGMTYYYRIAANGSTGCGPSSQPIVVEAGRLELLTPIWSSQLVIALVVVIVCAGVAGIAWARKRRDAGALANAIGQAGEGVAEDTDLAPSAGAQGTAPGVTGGYIVERVFVVYRDGRLVMECSKEGCATADADLTSAMLIAVQGIIQDGLERGGRLESIRYGENLILIASGEYVTLAAVIYGHPADELKADLESTVRLIESSYAGVIDEWVGDLSSLGGIKGMVEQFLGKSQHLTREDVGAVPAERGITLLSAIDLFRGYVRLKVAALNDTGMLITDAALQVRYDPDMLRLECAEPKTLRLWGDRVTLGVVKPDERKTVSLLFDPQICQETYIDGTLTYYDVKGRFQHVDMKRRNADVVCPALFTPGHISTAVLRRLMKDELHVSDRRMLRYPLELSGEEVLGLAKQAIGGNEVQVVREYTVGGPPYRAEVWYYGQTRIGGRMVVMRLRVEQSTGLLEFFVASSTMEPITGLLADFRRELSRALDEKYVDSAGLEVERDEEARREMEERPLLLDADVGEATGDVPGGGDVA